VADARRNETRELAVRDVASVLPQRAHALARLNLLADGREPIVTVIGKYNHGKSRLLNELIGRDEFSVADKRETVDLRDHVQRGVRWLDAPGLDADVGSEDDRQALRAAWLESDIRLFVHAAKEGELDAKELNLLGELRDDEKRTQRQIVFVLSQIDQLADEHELQKVSDAVAAQTSGLALNAVSSVRHRSGVAGGKKLLLEKSGIPALRATLDGALTRVPQARAHESALLFSEILGDLQQLQVSQEELISALRATQEKQRKAFDAALRAILDKAAANLRLVIDAPVPDYARDIDSAADHYRQTAAKLERARIQTAYSRACIMIDAVLVAQGVIGLPEAQQTGVRAMDSVMVAVLGVSVKFRDDLRRIFCSDAGREKLQREFSVYFEASKDRRALQAQIAQAETSLAASTKALASLRALEPKA
jgi:hypothetical protein